MRYDRFCLSHEVVPLPDRTEAHCFKDKPRENCPPGAERADSCRKERKTAPWLALPKGTLSCSTESGRSCAMAQDRPHLFCFLALYKVPGASAPEILTFQNLRRNGGLPNGRVHTMNNSKTSLQGFDPCGFGKRLQSARKALGITQEELAERLRVDRNHITRMERGIRVCSIDLLVEISVALEVSTDYLLTGETSSMVIKQKLLAVIEQLNQIAQNL